MSSDLSDVMAEPRCPTCGQRAHFEQGREGTSYYVGDAEAEVERLQRAVLHAAYTDEGVEIVLADLRKQKAEVERWQDRANRSQADVLRYQAEVERLRGVLQRIAENRPMDLTAQEMAERALDASDITAHLSDTEQ